MILQVSLFVVAALALAAHFVRMDSLPFAVACVLVPLLFLIRRRWILVVLQLAAYAAAAIWIMTAVEIALERHAAGLAWIRAASILGAVALLTLAAGVLLNSRAAKKYYPF
jgi:hypothetical protein